ncbi:MAG: PAS domain S-box protein [Anaerolineae bacterium]|nr:PAS domain S-box protein [Anaerolineae bacterium]
MVQRWNALSITTKFNIAFGMLLSLVLLVTLGSYIALTVVRQRMVTAIATSVEIQRLVLEMDRGLEKARRLQRDFFLQYPEIGFAEARDIYALQAIEQLDYVAELSTELKQQIAQSHVSTALQAEKVNLTLYLSSAERNAETLLETVEMVTTLAEEDTGLLVQLTTHATELYDVLESIPALLTRYREMQAFEKDYLLTRQRPFLQSALNVGQGLGEAIETTTELTEEQQTQALHALNAYLQTAERIADLDVAIRGKFRDFDLQAASLDPISQDLLRLATEEVARAQEQTAWTSHMATGIFGAIAGLGLLMVILISGIFSRSVTRNIVVLTQTASALQQGKLDVIAQVSSADELGRLAETFNAMTAEIHTRITAMTALNQALQASEQKYRKLFENSYNAIVITTPVGDFLDINEAGLRLFGYDWDVLQKLKVQDLYVYPEERAKFRKKLERDNVVSDFEIRWRQADGTIIDLLLNASVQRAEDGSITNYQTVIYDITERKKVEALLKESEARLNLALEGTNTGLWDYRPQVDPTYYSARWFTMLGYTPDEFPHTYTTWVTLLHPEDRTAALARLETFVNGTDEFYTNEFRMRAKEGGWRWISSKGKAVERDAAGHLIRLIGTHTDITDRKRATEEREQLLRQIREQARQTRYIVDTVPEGMFLLDTNMHVVLANAAGQKDLHILAEIKLGDRLTKLGDRPLSELLTSPPHGLWHEIVHQGQIFEVIARPIEIDTMNGIDYDLHEHWVVAIRDVTQQRQIEKYAQQQERLAAVGQLAAGIAHDFNNIMATIVLYAQMTARAPELSTRSRERMTTIYQQAIHASNLIQQILDFSRRAVLERRRLDLLPLLKEQVKLLQRTLPENIRITSSFNAEAYIVNGDPTRIQQMLMNLAVNARDAMPEGGNLHFGLDQLHIITRKRLPLPDMTVGKWIKITVSDTGTGIAPEVLPRIFDPFFTTKAPDKGTGLGLAQVHGIVSAHEGKIDVQTHLATSQDSETSGTTFIIYFPALEVTESEPPAIIPQSLPLGHGETLLLVEDDAVTRAALVESLELLNYHILVAKHGKEALAILKERCDEIALVVSDVVMPEMGGVALLRTLQNINCRVNIVLLSGHPMDETLEGLRSEVANTDAAQLVDWLPKPPRLEQLADVVARGLRRTEI